MEPKYTGLTKLEVDVTNWSMPDRVELLAKIDEINNRPVSVAPAVLAADVASDEVDGETVEETGWTYAAYEKVMLALISGNYYAQAYVINEAIKNGTGYVAREKVYDISSYPAHRSLKGFTRPVNRVVAEVVEQGLLPDDADHLLQTHYPAGSARAEGFRVPLEVVKLVLDHKPEGSDCADAQATA